MSLSSSAAVLLLTRPSRTNLSLRHESKRREISRARRVVLEEKSVDPGVVEKPIGDRLVAPRRHPTPAQIAAAQMHPDGHVRRPLFDDPVHDIYVGSHQRVRIVAVGADLRAYLIVAEHRDRHFVELDVIRAELCQRRYLVAVDRRRGPTRIARRRDRRTCRRNRQAEEMQEAGRRHRHLGVRRVCARTNSNSAVVIPRGRRILETARQVSHRCEFPAAS